jgi:glycosyltransferase involved in cell wall biosynthesis
MAQVSVTLATLNEAAHLDACLRAVAWADEIVVVDDGSTDGTVELTRRYTDRVAVRPSHGNFHANKNLAIEMATGDWILSLDADEVVPPDLAAEIRAVIKATPHAAYRVGRRNYFLGRWIRHGGWYPDRIIRLFRKGVTQWPLEVHWVPQVSPPATVGELRAELAHYSYRSLEQYFEKFNRYTTKLAREARGHGRTPGLRSVVTELLLRPPAWFAYKYVALGGFRDGIPGLFIALSSALTIMVAYFKLWEMHASHPPETGP